LSSGAWSVVARYRQHAVEGPPGVGDDVVVELDLEALLASMGTRLDAAVLMDVELNILMKRLTGRRTCSITGKLLNIYFSTQAELDECTSDGGELLQRKDDNEETIAHRLDVYRLQTEPLIDFYRSRDLLRTVAADGDVDVVYQRLLEAL